MVKYQFTRGRDVDLKEEQAQTLSMPILPANLILKSMFLAHPVLPYF